MDNSCGISLGEAAGRFLATLSPKEGVASQHAVYRFVRWYGWERPIMGLVAPEVANFATRLSLSDIDYARKLEVVRSFLMYTKKQGWSKINLAAYLKEKKVKAKLSSPSKHVIPQTISLTRQGYVKLVAELDSLRNKRIQSIDEISKAAADKDFRENAPLDAAREQHNQIVGRIGELEEILKSANIIEEKQEIAIKASIGDSIILYDLSSGEELHYMLVSSREVDLSKGKISSSSPLGKAIIGRSQGETVEIKAPAGKLRYKIKKIGDS